jgi:hypothetical protein
MSIDTPLMQLCFLLEPLLNLAMMDTKLTGNSTLVFMAITISMVKV